MLAQSSSIADAFVGIRAEDLPAPAGVPPVSSPAWPKGRKGGRRERRRSFRFPARTDVVVRPVAADGSPAGEPFRAVITELSKGGMRLVSDRPVEALRLAVRFGLHPGGPVRMMEVARVSGVGAGLHESAGPFVLPVPATVVDGGPAAGCDPTEFS